MQVHGPSSSGDRIEAELNPSKDSPFAIIRIDTIRIFLDTPAECDRLIEAFTQARDLLSHAAGEGDAR